MHTYLSARDIQSLEAVKLYYQDGKAQQEVAKIMGLSRPTVAKLIQHATERGYVEIRINDPRNNHDMLVKAIREKYSLSEVRIVSASQDYPNILSAIGQAGARMLESIITDGDALTIEWSNSIQAMAQALNHQPRKNIKVIQLRGSDTQISQGLNEASTIHLICQAFEAIGETLPLPAVFDNVHTKTLMEQEQHIRRILENARNSRIAIFTVGTTQPDNLLFRSGFFSTEEMDQLRRRSVGSICARFLDAEGRICLPDLNNRTTGISLPDLRHKEQRILIAGGLAKAPAIRVALQYGYANRLVTDAATAQLLLAEH